MSICGHQLATSQRAPCVLQFAVWAHQSARDWIYLQRLHLWVSANSSGRVVLIIYLFVEPCI